MKLITERIEDVQYITEAADDGTKKLYIEGVFLQSAIKNRNGRVYPEQVMDKEAGRYIKEAVENNTAVGELGHPSSGTSVNLDKISHKIVSLKKEGTNYIGKALVINTPMGNIARSLIESGIKVGVSSRGMGTVKENTQGIKEVQSDFRLVTAADIVSDPSAPDAWVNGILEGVEFYYAPSGALIKEDIAEKAKREIEEIAQMNALKEEKMNRTFNAFKAYLNEIASRIG